MRGKGRERGRPCQPLGVAYAGLREEGWGGEARATRSRRAGFLAASLAAVSRALQAESDRWFLWLPVLFAGGIIAYFALGDEPSLRVAAAFLIAASGSRFFDQTRATRSLYRRAESGNLVFPPATAASYSTDNWLLADGDERDITAASDKGAFRCDRLGCMGTVKGKTVALVRHPAALEEDCRVADIVIAPFTVGNAAPRASSSIGAC